MKDFFPTIGATLSPALKPMIMGKSLGEQIIERAMARHVEEFGPCHHSCASLLRAIAAEIDRAAASRGPAIEAAVAAEQKRCLSIVRSYLSPRMGVMLARHLTGCSKRS